MKEMCLHIFLHMYAYIYMHMYAYIYILTLFKERHEIYISVLIMQFNK